MEYLVTVFHNYKKKISEISHLLVDFGFKNTFAKNGQLVKLPESLFVKTVTGTNPTAIRDNELARLESAWSEFDLNEGSIGVFVGEDWTKKAAV